MKLYKKVLILVFLVALVSSGIYVVDNYLTNYFSLQSADPTVYVENGVSGTVTITDPSLNKTTDIKIAYYSFDAGSGAIITSNGYVITAFHVVGDPKSLHNRKLKRMDHEDIDFYLEQAAVKNYLSRYNPQLGHELLNNTNSNGDIRVLTESLVRKNLINVKSGKQVIKVNLRTSTRIASLNAQLVDVGDSASDDDVALLKLNSDAFNSVGNLPHLNVSLQKPTIGDSIRIYGYPGNRMQSQSIVPSVATGQLTATTYNSFGTIYYQTTAPTASGYSGGPVLNSKNRVIGIVIYGIKLTGQFNPQIDSQSSLFLSSNYIVQICEKNNVPITVAS